MKTTTRTARRSTITTPRPSYTVHFQGTVSNCGFDRAYADEVFARIAASNPGAGLPVEMHEHINGNTTIVQTATT